MNEETLIKKAEFNPKVCTYWLLSGIIVLTCIVVGIPFLLLWIPIGLVFTKRYLDRMECLLTEKALIVKKGIFVRVEKTIPLEKITDMGMVQGPIMRRFGLHQLTVETAGQSGPAGSLVSLTGIVDAESFRQLVLSQRELIASASTVAQPVATTGDASDSTTLLREMRDALLRIEANLDKLGKE